MDEQTKAMRHLLTGLEMNGVAVVTVSDGCLYAFSKQKLLELAEQCVDGKVLVFVKTGPEAPAGQEN